MSKLSSAVKGGARILHVCDFGHSLLPYGVALSLQSQLADSIKANQLPDTLLQLQVSIVLLPSVAASGLITRLLAHNTIQL